MDIARIHAWWEERVRTEPERARSAWPSFCWDGAPPRLSQRTDDPIPDAELDAAAARLCQTHGLAIVGCMDTRCPRGRYFDVCPSESGWLEIDGRREPSYDEFDLAGIFVAASGGKATFSISELAAAVVEEDVDAIDARDRIVERMLRAASQARLWGEWQCCAQRGWRRRAQTATSHPSECPRCGGDVATEIVGIIL